MNVAYASIIFAVLFLALLALLHFLKPEFDPSWRMISEYEIGRFGWLMRLAFFAWGASVLALLVAIWPSLQPIAGTIARWWFVVIAIALFGAGIFKTDPITDITDSVVNRLHTLCGAIVILTFPVAAALAVHGLTRDPLWSASQGLLIVVTALTWIGVVSFFASIIIARRRVPSAGAGGPTIRMGWPNRFMVVTYAVWIIVVAATSLRL